ncbi:FMN-binding negative transcriptional regulator [Pedococcus bigeumensis]|uniref:FMN-binding negative transcriptional regulator n=1 Tax=Pedococcus bigeumensis TaxID=433644 RepID=A0A502CXP1_9MICO|nr:FMN-binding negative transcriptional regulator [Pedococcus bigeumensis]TPG17300.1 FMN-binding negative transcriptional regulator [Pedococcus bigeumensis]
MYVPHFNAMTDDAEIRRLVAEIGSAQLITVGADGFPLATLLPVIWRDDTVIAHMARANQHWKAIGADRPVLLVVTGPQAYISPNWYASKAEHGKVVPTWNYSVVQLSGRATVHDDPHWVRGAVDELGDRHEGHRDEPWRSSDAPDKYIQGQLRAIVGVEISVERVEAKAKFSQNRSGEDRAGVVTGLLHEDSRDAVAVAEQMRAAGDRPA